MKYCFSIFLLFLFTPFHSQACDVCSGVSNGFNIDISGQQTTNSVGVGYRFVPFRNNTAAKGNPSFIHMMDINGSYSPVKNFVIIASLPYIHSIIKDGETVSKYSGLGDMLLNFNYKVLSKVPEKNSDNKHELSFSSGVEFPTGKYVNDIENLPVQQTGSRSFDFIFGGNYQFTKGNWWISNSTIYKLNTTNKFDYKFGNSQWSALYAAYSIRKTKHLIRPIAGVDVINQQKNIKDNIYQAMTGGFMFRTVGGLSYKVNDFQVTFLSQIPVYQKMKNTAIKFQPDLSLKLFFNF